MLEEVVGSVRCEERKGRMGLSFGVLGLLIKGEFTDMAVGKELLQGLAVGCTAYTFLYALAARRIKESKRRAWIPTCLTATVSSITGAMVAANTIQNYWQGLGSSIWASSSSSSSSGSGFRFTDFSVSSLLSSLSVFSWHPDAWTETALTKFCVASFLSFLVMDVVIGFFHYAKHFHFLEGWVHHAVYICFLAETYLSHQTGIFAHFGVEEIPTFILGFGTIFPECRSDNLFGFTFFMTRLLWHFIGTYNAAMAPDGHPVRSYTWFGYMSMLLHLHWFYTWCTKYLFKSSSTTKSKDKGKKKE